MQVENCPVDNKRNIALLTEYDGSGFLGWQNQKNGRTIQEAIQKAIYDITGESVILYGCSRTDAGVHAKGHVSNFFSLTKIPERKIPLALNSKLPESISVIKAQTVAGDFDSRFCAKGKKYAYRIHNASYRPALDRNRVYHIPDKLDTGKMEMAASKICGTHDFSCFAASNSEVKSSVRTVKSIEIVVNKPGITIFVTGDGFLYNMVRIIAGTLFYVGVGKISPGEIEGIIESKDRRLSGKTLPPRGLCLERVYYDPEIFESIYKTGPEENYG